MYIKYYYVVIIRLVEQKKKTKNYHIFYTILYKYVYVFVNKFGIIYLWLEIRDNNLITKIH